MLSLPTGSSTRLRLRHHLVALVVVLLGVFVVLDADHSWTRDDGFYATQVHALADGSWGIDTPYAVSEGAARSLEVTSGERYAYSRHPAWPAVQRIPYEVLGERGLRVLPLAGVLLAALAAWALASATTLGRPEHAFWLTAVAPVLLHGTGFWAIAPAAALAALAVLAAIQAGRRGHPIAWHGLLAASICGAVLLRSEGLIVAVAIALSAWLANDRGRRIGVAATAAVSGAVAHTIEGRWIDAIVEDGASGGAVARSFDGGSRLGAAATSLWSGGYADPLGSALGLAGLLAVAGAAYVLRRGHEQSERKGAAMLLVAVAAYVLRAGLASGDVVPGLFAAWPVVVLALARARRFDPVQRFLVAFSLLVGAAVLASQYSDGGGLQWGGRFFAVVIVPVAVLAAPRLEALVADLPRLRSRVVLVAVAPVLLGCLAVVELQADHRVDIDTVVATEPDVVLSARGALPNLAWSDANSTGRVWLQVLPADLAYVAAQLENVRVAFVGYSTDELAAASVPEVGPAGATLVVIDID